MNLQKSGKPPSFLLAAGIALMLAGCGATQGSADSDAARQQFLAERGANGTPGAATSSQTPAANGMQIIGVGPGADGKAPGAFGTVQKVDGSTITVANPMNGSATKIHLADSAKLTRQVEARLTDLKVGDYVFAAGTQDGDTLKANVVQIGDSSLGAAPAQGGGNKDVTQFQQPAPGGGQVQTYGGAPGDMGTPPTIATGTVEKIDGSTLTVKSADGKTTGVQVGEQTNMQKDAEIKASEITEGMTLVATGEQKGDQFEATSIQVVQAIMQQKAP